MTKTVALGAPDRWDFVVFDPASHKVFIAHGDRVTVVDGRTGKVVGNVEGLPGGTHGVAIVPGTERGYTDDGRAGTAASFDLDKLNLIKTIKADADADAIVFDPTSGHVFVVDGDPGKLTVIDPKSDSAVATIDAGGKLETAVAGGDGKLYVNGEEKQEIVRVDTATNEIDAHWPMPNCTSPHGLAIDPRASSLFKLREQRACCGRCRYGNDRRHVTNWSQVGCGRLRSQTQAHLQFQWRWNAFGHCREGCQFLCDGCECGNQGRRAHDGSRSGERAPLLGCRRYDDQRFG